MENSMEYVFAGMVFTLLVVWIVRKTEDKK
jgi:hypothetical protein